MATWTVDKSKILQPHEIKRVLAELARKGRRSLNTRLNRVVFRLACCAGLRASEIAGLILADVQLDSTRPQIRVRKEIAKCKKARKVPLTWDEGTLNDLREWKRFRREQGAGDDARFVCSQHRDTLGNPLDRRNLRKRFKVACKCLGTERQTELTIHHGRHSFVSHALPVTQEIAAGSTAECHAVRGYRFDRPSASGNRCRATCVGACPGGDKPDGSCRAARGCADAQTTLRIRSCDRRWFRRPTALPDTTKCENCRSRR